MTIRTTADRTAVTAAIAAHLDTLGNPTALGHAAHVSAQIAGAAPLGVKLYELPVVDASWIHDEVDRQLYQAGL